MSGQDLCVDRVVTVVGSALNGKRRRFLALLGDPKVSTIVVANRAARAVKALGQGDPA